MKPERAPGIGGEEGRETLGQVGIHQPLHSPLRDRLQRGQGDRQEVERLGHRLAVEVPAREHVAVVEHQRIVGRGVELDLDRLARERIASGDRAEHLRRAAQAVGVLHPRVVLAMGLADLARRPAAARISSAASTLPAVRTRFVDPRVERRRRSAQRLEAHRRRARPRSARAPTRRAPAGRAARSGPGCR